MKNKFIIFAFQIINMGGEQQYCRNKLHCMAKLGYDINLLSADSGNICISELKQYSNNTINELRYTPFCFSKKRINVIVEKICNIIGACTVDSIIESVNPATAEWAELVAQRLGCKHISFMLDEYFTISKSEYDFFNFKYERNELMGIAVQTLQLLFKNYKPLKDTESYYFDAACSNVIEDIDCDLPWYETVKLDGKIKIGSIGRLEKGFVLPSLLEIKKYAEKNPLLQFDIVLIGGTDDKKVKSKISKLFKNTANISLFITDYIYPIPQKLLQILDVCFSTASSALITAVDYNVPTISVDTFTGSPIGILNYTTTENMYSQNKEIKLELFLDMILKEHYCLKHKSLGMEKSKDDNTFINEVKRQLDFVRVEKRSIYYDTSSLQPSSVKYKIYSYIGKLFGVKVLNFIHIKVFHKFKMLFSGNTKKEY